MRSHQSRFEAFFCLGGDVFFFEDKARLVRSPFGVGASALDAFDRQQVVGSISFDDPLALPAILDRQAVDWRAFPMNRHEYLGQLVLFAKQQKYMSRMEAL